MSTAYQPRADRPWGRTRKKFLQSRDPGAACPLQHVMLAAKNGLQFLDTEVGTGNAPVKGAQIKYVSACGQ